MKPMDLFIKNAKEFRDGTGKTHYSKENKELFELAKKGIDPCDHCEKRKYCATVQCLPYYEYFSFRWGRIQRGYRHAMEG